MANEVKWLVPQRVAYFSMEGDISNDEFARINEAMAALIQAGQSPIHIVAQVSQIKRPPMDIQWIARKTAIQDEKVGHVVVIGANSLAKFIAQMVKNITKSNMHMVDSLEEAQTLLHEKDSTIPTL